ncbi:MAG: dimethyl sulfoxide reductase anchor subunit [Polyangiaceae bacterium]|nr:dimethyl sulfoxide reductase anchor subunit [Polyangiaceae bacterium]
MTASHVTTEEGGRTLIRLLLADQQRLTAVERFGAKHDEATLPAQEKYYRDLIPLSEPRTGEQYVFEVDLDACTGCKACVAGCHSLNGLDDGEVWRQVGVVAGPQGADARTVTSACHHCAEPACMSGCPVKAYEKDPVTGIVRHLDDQCIGCQYCVLKCPYDVPQYNAAKGIVRKCDMCHGRLSEGEAPACVQACPTGAIRIGVAPVAEIAARGLRGEFLPGAPDPAYTRPSTVYASSRGLTGDLRPGDEHRLRVEPTHAPLVFMLVLTQASVGVTVAHGALSWLAPSTLAAATHLRLSLVAAALGLLGIAGATLHLGRPLYAFRAFLGVRTSWLSRETVVFGAQAPLLLLHVLARATGAPARLADAALSAVVVAGALAVLCSVMVYVDTRRASWSLGRTSGAFVGTALSLGVALTAALVSAGGGAAPRWLFAVVALVSLAKLALESSVLRHVGASPVTDLARTARVLLGPQRTVTGARFAIGAAGVAAAVACASAASPGPALAGLLVVAVFTGDALERALFFRAVAAPRMPGNAS